MATPNTPPHFFTVDVEDYFQVVALEPFVPRSAWDGQEGRVERNMNVLLDLLARHETVGTFFTLGWVAQRFPALVRRFVEQGHEVASHGWWHLRVTGLTPGQFREDVRSSKRVLEDTTGRAVHGYRAPSFSIVPGLEWAFDVLLEEGYHYDSSLFPIHRPDYGYPSAPPVPHMIARPAGRLLELPMATTAWLGLRLPAAGGGYLRQLPYALTERAFREHSEAGQPGMFYIHPWEVDPGQPRVSGLPLVTRIRHYRGLDRTLPRLERLLRQFRFTSVARRYGIRPGLPEGSWAESLPT
jgi:polysaccharide deacetylase family protein (PEP-CTERM system associated)